MTKAVVPFGYNQIVLDLDDAVKFLGFLAKAERYDTHGWGDERNNHVWKPNDDELTLKILPDEVYHGARLAGKKE